MILPTLYSETKRKARKSYKCSSCQANIAKGETYRHIKGKWDGEFEQYRLCGCCGIVSDKILDESLEGHYSIKNVYQYVFETQDIDETAADIADKLKLPVAYVAGIINR